MDQIYSVESALCSHCTNAVIFRRASSLRHYVRLLVVVVSTATHSMQRIFELITCNVHRERTEVVALL